MVKAKIARRIKMVRRKAVKDDDAPDFKSAKEVSIFIHLCWRDLCQGVKFKVL